MVAITILCVMAFNLDFHPVRIHTAISISANPIIIVKDFEYSCPIILATISRCLGTKSRTLQNNPFTSHTAAIE